MNDQSSVAGGLVRYEASCPDLPDELLVERFEATEEIGRPYRITLQLLAAHEHSDLLRLLGHDLQIVLERDGRRRGFAGIVSRVALEDGGDVRQRAAVTVEPALCALRLTRSTRIFQDERALDIVQAVLGASLGPYGREVDCALVHADEHPVRDYCVQYQETDFDFVHRLLEEEGVGYFFEHHEVERMRLFDRTADLGEVEAPGGALVHFDRMLRNAAAAETIVRFAGRGQLAPTRVTVRDHDWTRRSPRIEAAAGDGEGLREKERAHELYDHGAQGRLAIRENMEELQTLLSTAQAAVLPIVANFGVTNHHQFNLWGVPVPSFTSEDSARQAGLRRESARRDAVTAAGTGLVAAFGPGLHFELTGHPTVGADGGYLITRVVHRSEPAGSEIPVNYHNLFDCLPRGVPWRPLQKTPKPRVHGVQTARVTGPVGMNVFTDSYGRIKVRFHWDRAEEMPSGEYTCWIRVSQSWAGQGAPGFMFIPRIGMEVVVSFVDGDPDRPLVTGCVYNGENTTPQLLPLEATKSVIRTRTIPHGPGYNEISFEDAMGAERVHLRAERDLDELVQNDRSSRVGRDQTSDVAGNRSDETGGDHCSTVGGERTESTLGAVTIDALGGERRVVVGSATLKVAGSQSIEVDGGSRVIRVIDGEHVLISDGRTVISQGTENHIVLHTNDEAEDKKGIVVHTPSTLTLKAGDATLTMNADGAGSIELSSPKEIKLVVGDSKLLVVPASIQANKKTFPV